MSEQVKIVLAVDAAQVETGAARASRALSDVEKAAQKAGTGTATAGKQAADGLGKQSAAADKATAAEKQIGDAAGDAADKSAAASKKATAAKQAEKEAAEKVGNSLLTLGTVAVAAAGGSVVAAAKWESAYAGVRKTVDGTAQEMKVLEGKLRGITKVASASHTEVAGVAEAAGQLGVARGDVAKFTKTMVDLGVATNLTAEEAAVSIRQFMNIMGSAPESVDRIGASIVGLGNNSATTERDIVAMSQRLAGAGKQARMSESEVLALAAAMASVGIEAEAGGTAMSLTLKQIDAMVRGGGPKLELLGKISGMSGKQFADAWGVSAAGATNTLVLGLGRMSASGEDVNGVLAQLGFEGIRQTDTLLRLSGATQAMGGEVDLLSNSLKISAEAFAENTALQVEAATRYGTTAEKAKIAANQLNDGLIDVGNALLPMANQGIQVVSDLANAFSALPDPVKGTLGAVTGLVGVMALGAGGALKAATAFQTAKAAVTALGGSMRSATISGGAIGLALAAVAAVIGTVAGDMADYQKKVDGYTEALKQAGEASKEAVRQQAAQALAGQGVADSLKAVGLSASVATDAVMGDAAARASIISAYDNQIAKLRALEDAALAEGTSTGQYTADADAAASARDKLISLIDREAGALGTSAAAVAEENALLGENSTASANAAAETQKAAEAKSALAAASQAAEQELRAYIDALYAESDAHSAALTGTLNVNSAMLDARDRATEWKEEAEKAGISAAGAFDQGTRAGIENNKVMLRAVQAAKDDVQAKIEQGASTEDLVKLQNTHRDSLVSTAKQFGVSQKDAEAYISQLFATPNSIETIAALQATVAQAKLAEWKDRLDKLPAEEVTAIKALLDRGQVSAAEARLNQAARERTARINVQVSRVGLQSSIWGSQYSAAGNLFEFYAAGGVDRVGDVRNAHQPAIVPAGTWRTFAEDETGGEAYIPLRNDWRRPRAESILSTVADRFGLSLVRDAQQFALGGLTTASYNAIRNYQTGTLPVAEFAKLNAELTRTATIMRQTASAAASTAASQRQATAARAKAEANLKAARDNSAGARAQEALKAAKAKPAKSKAQKAARDKAIKAAQAAVDRAKRGQADAIKAAQVAVDRAKAAEAKATENNKAAQDRAKDAAKEAADAAKELGTAHKQLADSARRVADQLRDTYMVGADAADLLTSMQQGAGNIAAFAGLVEQLRARGLSEDLVQQIIDQGEVWGAETAKDILKGGKPTIDALNSAAASLKTAADRLGLLTVVGQKQYADGGIEVHQAMIGTGIRRVWDEPETGGEAYIPLAASKRARSIPIWQKAGELLGVARPTVALANGAILTAGTFARPVAQQQSVTYNVRYDVRLPDSIRDAAQMVAFFDQAPLNLHRTGMN